MWAPVYKMHNMYSCLSVCQFTYGVTVLIHIISYQIDLKRRMQSQSEGKRWHTSDNDVKYVNDDILVIMMSSMLMFKYFW